MPLSNNYSLVEKALHYFAFSRPFVQKALGSLESDLYRGRFRDVVSRGEVFVTGLPRAGTTLLFDLLFQTGEFNTFTYRHMPFILSPLLWHDVSKSFHKEGQSIQRAHGDGMQISFDSPEAFEEVIWLSYLKREIVGPFALSPLQPQAMTSEFKEAFRDTVRKVLAISLDSNEQVSRRYLSKNNANISRIAAIEELFPTATMLVVFREPLAHACSLATQHARFLERHTQDRFSKRYMRWIGHFEFGENLKPINFDGWMDRQPMPVEADASFWLEYWNQAYRYAIDHCSDQVRFVDYDGLLREGAGALARIGRSVDLRNADQLVQGAEVLRAPTTKAGDLGYLSPELVETARDTHAELRSLAI